MIWLLQISPLIVGTLTVIVVVALSLIGLFIFRRLVSQTRLESAHGVSGEVFFSLAGVLRSVATRRVSDSTQCSLRSSS